MSGFKVNFSVNNQKATPSMHAAPFAQRPAAGQPGRVFIDTDSPSTGIYRDTGTTWIQIASTSSPEADTLQTVTDRGNTTTQSITIGDTTPPAFPLDVYGDTDIINVHATNGNDGVVLFSKAGSHRWRAGNYHGGGNDYFSIYNMQENSDGILVNISTNNVAIGGHTTAPVYKLDIAGSLANTGAAYFGTSGNDVGIGTTSPGTYLAGVSGAAIFRSGVTTGLSIATGTTNYILQYLNTSGQFVKFAGPTAQRISTQFLSTGNLIIGTGTTDAGYKLSVSGQTYIDVGVGANIPILRMRANNATHYFYGDASSFLSWSGAFRVDQALSLQNGMNSAFGKSYDYNAGNISNVNTIRVNSGSSQNILVGSGSADVTALITLNSNTRGFLPPRMTTTEKNAIANTAGLIVFDTTLAKLCVNSGAGWETITSV